MHYTKFRVYNKWKLGIILSIASLITLEIKRDFPDINLIVHTR